MGLEIKVKKTRVEEGGREVSMNLRRIGDERGREGNRWALTERGLVMRREGGRKSGKKGGWMDGREDGRQEKGKEGKKYG